MKKLISITLVLTMIINLFTIPVNARESKITETIYINGVKFDVSLNENMEITINGSNQNSAAKMTLNSNGEGEIILQNNKEKEFFDVDINTLNNTEIDVDVFQNNHLVDTFSTIDDIIEDSYSGQIAIFITTEITITIGMILESLIAAGLVVIISEVLYIVATEFYSAVQSATKTKKEKAKKKYYPATVYKGTVVIKPKAISKKKAIKRVKKGQSVYSFSSTKARDIILQAGYSHYPTGSYGEIDNKRIAGNIYLRHYHIANSKGYAIHNGFHSFYGSPVRG